MQYKYEVEEKAQESNFLFSIMKKINPDQELNLKFLNYQNTIIKNMKKFIMQY